MSLLLRDRRALAGLVQRALPAARQVRWESKAATAGDARKADGRDAATVLLMSKQAAKADDGDGGRQTVRPPAMPASPAEATKEPSLQRDPAAKAGPSTTVDRVPRLTDAEEAQVDEMRGRQEDIKAALQGVLQQFGAPVRYAFAYGSGVYKQSGYSAAKPMVDLVLAVSHPDHWHALNIGRNRAHYSFMGTLGAQAVTFVQDRMGAGVYYNPFVEINGVMVKYGVVSMDTLGSDLLNWDTLYLAGRMHKPTLTLRRDPLMRISKQVNLTHAVRAALLMLPKNFSARDLFRTIAGLSFLGDFRMRIGGENPRKVDNIVDAQLPLFKARYGSIVEGLPNLEYIGADLLQQDMGPASRAAMLRKMPNNLYDGLVRQGRKHGLRLPPGLGAETVNTERLVRDGDIGLLTRKAIEGIVARPALTQAAKGVLSSGLVKTAAYMYAKNKKHRGVD
ncbi:Mitochondrial translocator assembly and maintenance protein 41 [Coemansia javaensis]|uniref:Phosphatidate cytidylyltransferase, mitochondrial n=1 Tax=Coemansia javaensis TaxID=2761396 RepID=A0A9W8HEJ5_9FUNG|nr:Mitochondrial translocator assembly and maintenance protein 41 [Coemansia javaensis]